MVSSNVTSSTHGEASGLHHANRKDTQENGFKGRQRTPDAWVAAGLSH